MSTDQSVWRVCGDPLVAGSGTGPLVGDGVAVKDLYAVAGHRTGAGNPTWLAEAAVETTSASVVRRLLAAGADVRGLARTDELAYSLAGTNAHTGTPPNPRAPGRVSGGSSSGSASAVSLGEASIGLGTDTGGSIRVPAAYQGLFGLRTTHGLVERDGLLALAPDFDTVGWLTRDADTLHRVGQVLLPPAETRPLGDLLGELVVVGTLTDLADPDVRREVAGWADLHGARPESWPLDDLPTWRAAFQTWQAWQAWAEHGAWLTRTGLQVLGPDVRARFTTASQVTADDASAARTILDEASDVIRDLVGDRVLVLPAAPTVAPELGDGLAERMARVREAAMTLTCLAGIAGLPGLAIPLQTQNGLPCGVCLVAGAGRDRDLLDLAVRL